MECPSCTTYIGNDQITITDRDDLAEAALNVSCPGCGRDFTAVIEPDHFKEVA